MPESAKKLTTGYIFEKVTYHDVDELVQALAKNWEKGKGHLFRGYIRDHLKKNERYDLANISADAEESEDDHDVVFANWLYSMSGSFEKLYWKQKSWTLLELGKEILGKLWECADVYTKDKKKGFEEIVEFLQTDVLTLYCDSQKTVSPEHAEVAERVQRHVNRIRNLKGFERGFFREMYALAYTLTRKPVLLILGMKFEDYPAFMEYIESLYRDVQKEEELKKFLNKLGIKKGQLGDSSSLELQFSCWLNAVRERAEDYRMGKEA